jgi:hypothetical protein
MRALQRIRRTDFICGTKAADKEDGLLTYCEGVGFVDNNKERGTP